MRILFIEACLIEFRRVALNAAALAAMGCPVFACTPDQFPDLMAAALSKADINQWASAQEIETIRGKT